jgi:hypothetical protein
MRRLLAVLVFVAIPMQAHATPTGVPEIDGAMTLQAMALAGGIALLLKKKRSI